MTVTVEILEGRLQKSTPGSVGYDLYADHDCLLYPNSTVLINTGLRLKLTNCYGEIWDRSGMAAKYRVTTRAGVIDPDYAGLVGVVLVNENPNEAYQVRAGDRIAQILFKPLTKIEVVGKVTEGDQVRGQGGFGSSGVA